MAVLHGVGRVIYRVSPEDAANSEKVAGIGIQIRNFIRRPRGLASDRGASR